MTSSVTIGQIRKKAAELFDLPFRGFDILFEKTIYDADDDNKLLYNLKWSSKLWLNKYDNIPDDPELYLSQNQDYINELFILTSKANTCYVDYAWDILNMISCNKELQETINSIKVEVISYIYYRMDGMSY